MGTKKVQKVQKVQKRTHFFFAQNRTNRKQKNTKNAHKTIVIKMTLSFALIASLCYFGIMLLLLFCLILFLNRKYDKSGCGLFKYAWNFKSIYGAVIIQFYDTGFFFFVKCLFSCIQTQV